MNASTTLTLIANPPGENLQRTQFYQNKSSTTSSTSFYSFFPHETSAEHAIFLHKNEPIFSINNNGQRYTSLPIEDTQLLDNISQTPAAHKASAFLHKSHSYNGIVKPKSTILKQDSLNGRIATSLTCSDSEYEATEEDNDGSTNFPNIGTGTEEHDTFLLGTSNTTGNTTSSSTRRSVRTHGKSGSSICLRAHAFISRNWYLSYLVPLTILIALMFVAYFTRNYAKHLLYWIEKQNSWVIFGLFIFLFILVSFPIVVGYFVLMITSGYLFGCLKGLLTVILGANLGIAIAHVTIRSLRHRIPMHKLIKNETGRAILRVISGPRAFKVVLFTRLTPIPFGIQNAIFGVSSINPRVYHTATFLGLLPAQTINVYLGSTLRSMHEVLNSHGTALTGYISFCIEVVCGVALMLWVVQKARKELSDTLMSDISTDGKLIDIQV